MTALFREGVGESLPFLQIEHDTRVVVEKEWSP